MELGGVGVRPARPTTVPPTLNVTALQLMTTLVTLAVAVPEPVPVAMTQVWGGVVGWERTVTEYAVPVAIWVLKLKAPFPVAVKLSDLLF